MGVNLWLSMVIDRISISIPVKGNPGALYTRIYEMKSNEANIVPNGKLIITKKAYSTRLDFYTSKNKLKIADITVGISKGGHRYFKVGLYPPKYNSDEFKSFKLTLGLWFPEFNYEHLYTYGKVSYVEFAYDSLTHTRDIFIAHRSHCVKSCYYPRKDGKQGTLYLGGIDFSFSIYDKHLQLTETGQPSKHETRTRFEAKLRHLGLPPAKLGNLKNPFLRLEIADLKKAMALANDPISQCFMKECQKKGAPAAHKNFPFLRKKHTALLRAAKVPWWQPNKPWQYLPIALEKIAP